ncbi:MAG TPA: hypothetical protein VIF09_12300 [Polyangiaceae bacterium]|jgi:hypothetical protein
MDETSRGVRVFRVLLGVAAGVALMPVVGMILVFALLPALPIVLAIGAVLGPMNWIEEKEEEAEHRFGHHHWFELPIHAGH